MPISGYRKRKISTSGRSLPLGRHRAVSMSIEFSENYPWLGDFQESLAFFFKWTCYRYFPLFFPSKNQGFPSNFQFFPGISYIFSHHWPATFATGVPRCGTRVCAAERWAAPSTPWFPAEFGLSSLITNINDQWSIQLSMIMIWCSLVFMLVFIGIHWAFDNSMVTTTTNEYQWIPMNTNQ